jgi:hypothetical protein
MTMDEEDESIASPGQRFLWRSLLDQQRTIKKLAKKHKAPVWAFLGGDMVEGDTKFRTNAIHTRNDDIIKEMAFKTLKPVIDVAERIFIAKGTQAHVGRLEDLLAKDIIGAEIHPDTKKPIAHRWRVDVEGHDFMFQHHGKLGRLPWTAANALNQKATRLKFQYKNPPDTFVQAHNHKFETGSKSFPTLVIAAPCLKMPGDFEARIDVDETSYGGLYFVIKDGERKKWDAMLYEPKGLTQWQPE